MKIVAADIDINESTPEASRFKTFFSIVSNAHAQKASSFVA
jgi:hypothetical protein